jgi:general stress protein 26
MLGKLTNAARPRARKERTPGFSVTRSTKIKDIEMGELKLNDISEKMRDIDFAMLSTRTEGGAVAARPMSNNRQVEFDGDSYFFTLESTRTVGDIRRDPNVGLTYQSKSGALGMKPFFISIEGRAELIDDKRRFAEHWTKELDDWFKEGIETAGLMLVKVAAQRLHYWDGYDEGEIPVRNPVAQRV